MPIHEKLLKIQTELKAPKNLYNEFGKYNYRSCESILEAVKPLCLEENCTLVICDDVIITNAENYIKATAILTDIDGNEKIEVTAFAREAISKKGMDSSQITGASSSYARKYALNGLFLIDDTKDADSIDNTQKSEKTKSYPTPAKANPAPIDTLKVDEIMALAKQKGLTPLDVAQVYKRNAINELTHAEYENCIARLSKKPDKVTAND